MGFGKDGKGVIIRTRESQTSLGTLAAAAALKLDDGGEQQLIEDLRLIKSVIILHSEGFAANEFVIFGIADNQLTAAEIAEALVATPLNRSSVTPQERAERPVFVICQTGSGDAVPNQSMPMEKVTRWTFSAGWCFWAFNPKAAALTTGAVLTIQSTNFGVWVT